MYYTCLAVTVSQVPGKETLNPLTQLGIGGIFAILMIREVLNFLKTRKDMGASVGDVGQRPFVQDRFDRMERQVRELYTWHAREDTDGVKIWYTRPSLERAIRELRESVDAETAAFQALAGKISDQRGGHGDST